MNNFRTEELSNLLLRVMTKLNVSLTTNSPEQAKKWAEVLSILSTVKK